MSTHLPDGFPCSFNAKAIPMRIFAPSSRSAYRESVDEMQNPHPSFYPERTKPTERPPILGSEARPPIAGARTYGRARAATRLVRRRTAPPNPASNDEARRREAV